MRIRPVHMEFHYGTSFVSQSPEAYERLILDAMRGEATLFTRNDEIEALWGIVDPILTAWREDTESSEFPSTSPGRRGPRRPTGCWTRANVAAAVSDRVGPPRGGVRERGRLD